MPRFFKVSETLLRLQFIVSYVLIVLASSFWCVVFLSFPAKKKKIEVAALWGSWFSRRHNFRFFFFCGRVNFTTTVAGGRMGGLTTCNRRITNMQPTYYRHVTDVFPMCNRLITDTTTVGRLLFESFPVGLKLGWQTANWQTINEQQAVAIWGNFSSFLWWLI